tara:strand:- start:7904 stop:8182 length:279 start_codon:yes stop_codon:yes gene_type:complete
MAKKEKYNSMEQLSAMKLVELKAIAPEFEVNITKKMKKADVIKAIFGSKFNTYIDADAPTKANSIKVEKVKEEAKPVFTRPVMVSKRRNNFQ